MERPIWEDTSPFAAFPVFSVPEGKVAARLGSLVVKTCASMSSTKSERVGYLLGTA